MGKKEILKNIIWVMILIVTIVGLGIIGYGMYKNATMEVKNPVATIEVENHGTIEIELYPEYAPETVKNFIALANNEFYNGLEITRVVEDFMIQGGDINNDGTGNASISHLRDLEENEEDMEYGIHGEFVANDVDNILKFEKGTIGMARADFTQYSSSLVDESYNSGSSQFFIMTEDDPALSVSYTPFGRIISGMDVLETIAAVEVEYDEAYLDEETGEPVEGAEQSKPVEAISMTSITVDTKGVEYGLPELYEQFDYMSWMYMQYGIDPETMMMY